jgi:hypothetical protein
MPERIYNVYVSVFPYAGGRGGSYRDAAFTFLFHPIHGGVSVMYFAHGMQNARIKENPLGSCRFTRVYMRHNPYIS